MRFFNKLRNVRSKNNGDNKKTAADLDAVDLDLDNIPQHIAIIMDGNGRWAEKRNLPRNYGHRQGAQNLKKIVIEANRLGVKYLTAYAFSTENWNRPKKEVDDLMNLLLGYLKNADKELGGNNVRIKVIGEKEKLSREIIEEIEIVTEKTKKNTGITLLIALNYGGRTEIVQAAKKLAQKVKNGEIQADEINEDIFSKYLYTTGIPDPDLVIRPSGEMRISNFLLWQLSYSEFWFADILWPDFSKEDLAAAIKSYQQRDRRFGGI